MEKMNRKLLTRIENVLKIEFTEWQINYMLEIPMVFDMKMAGRCNGKTLVYIIKKLFSEDTPIDASDIKSLIKISDWFCYSKEQPRDDSQYIRWFRDYLISIYEQLNSAGIVTRAIIIDKKGEHHEKEYRTWESKYRFNKEHDFLL